jgi:cytidyltransferase-like protein
MLHKNIVWLSGVFDVLNIGHIKLFQRARQMGFPVVVGVREQYPFLGQYLNSTHDRVEILNAIKYIDDVEIFSTDEELLSIISKHSPRYMLVVEDNSNYTLDGEIIGEEYVKEIIYMKKKMS